MTTLQRVSSRRAAIGPQWPMHVLRCRVGQALACDVAGVFWHVMGRAPSRRDIGRCTTKCSSNTLPGERIHEFGTATCLPSAHRCTGISALSMS